jgi:hypothetical protein
MGNFHNVWVGIFDTQLYISGVVGTDGIPKYKYINFDTMIASIERRLWSDLP